LTVSGAPAGSTATFDSSTLFGGSGSAKLTVQATTASPGSYTLTITAKAVNGFAGTLSFSVSGLPSGASASFSPASVNGSGSTTLTLSTASGTAAGSYSLTISGTGGGLTRTAGLGLTVSAPACTTDTWGNWAHSFFTTNCTACHSQFGTYGSVQSDKTNIQTKISNGSMPAGSTLSASDKSRILQWISCGLPQ
jgi:hypothetical protein